MSTDSTDLEWENVGGQSTMDSDQSSSGLSRRQFVQLLGGGLLISVLPFPALGQQGGGGRGEGRGMVVAARLHIAKDGPITVMTGKVEGGQGARPN